MKDGGRHAQLALIEVNVMVIVELHTSLMRQTPHFPPSGVLEMIQKEKKLKKEKKSNEKEKESENPLSSPHRGGGSETPTMLRTKKGTEKWAPK
jgi:hypothetical protein